VAGIPPEPDAATTSVYLTLLKAVDPALAEDPDKAVRRGRNQCSTLNGAGDPTGHTAAERFSLGTPLTDDQGQRIDNALRLTLCPKG
jgi:hypothetical protein